MPAIAYQYDDDTRDILAGLERFLKVEVFARHQANERLLSDSRYTYTEDGRYAPEVLKLIAEVRRASAKAGYYTLCVPTDLGGGGFGKSSPPGGSSTRFVRTQLSRLPAVGDSPHGLTGEWGPKKCRKPFDKAS